MDQITLSDFQKLDIRIGTVIAAEVPEWSHWVMKLTVDLGSEIGERTIFAGIMKFFQPADLVGKQFPFVTNIEPRKMGPEGDYSQGMLMAATENLKFKMQNEKLNDTEDLEKPVLLSPWGKLPNGSKVR